MRSMYEELLVALDDAVTDNPLAANPVTKVKRPDVPREVGLFAIDDRHRLA